MPWWGWLIVGVLGAGALWAFLRGRGAGADVDRRALADAEARRRAEEVTAVTERDAAMAKTELNLAKDVNRAAAEAAKRKEESDEKSKRDAAALAAPGSDLLDRADRLAGRKPGPR